MKDVITTTPVKELTTEELQQIFGGSNDQATVLDGVFDPAGVVVTEDFDI